MLTYNQLISEIKQLPPAERLSLLEVITHSLREDVIGKPRRKAQSGEKLLGIAKPAGEIPDDEKIKEILVNGLLEKYLNNESAS